MKKIISVILAVVLCTLVSPVAFAQDETDIKILCLGKYIEPDVEPFYADSRIMAPVRAVFESLGALVIWDENLKCATGKMGEREVVLTLGSNIITVDGEKVEMDTVLLEKDDRVFAPIRFVAESFGFKVCYHDESRTAVISKEREYEFYDSLSVALPRFDSVTGAQFISGEKDGDGYDTFSYSYSEDYTTDYFNVMQSDFGYVLTNIYFKDGAHIYEYQSENSGHTVRVADYDKKQDVICITVTPNLSREYELNPAPYEERQKPFIPPVPETDVMPDIPDAGLENNSLDYGAVTGAALLEKHESEDGNAVFRYEYNMFTHRAYESFLMSNGWRFYDFDFDISNFVDTTYYSKGEELISVSVAHMFNEVWIVYP